MISDRVFRHVALAAAMGIFVGVLAAAGVSALTVAAAVVSAISAVVGAFVARRLMDR